MKLNRKLFAKVALFALLALGLVMITTSSLHALSTGTIYDNARSDEAVSKGTVTVVFSVVGFIVSGIGIFFVFKTEKILLPLLLIVGAIISFTIAFSVPLKSQYDTKNQLNMYTELYNKVSSQVDANGHLTGLNLKAAQIALIEKNIINHDLVFNTVKTAQLATGRLTESAATTAATGVATGFDQIAAHPMMLTGTVQPTLTPVVRVLDDITNGLLPKVNDMISNDIVKAKAHLYSINLGFFASLTGVALLNLGGLLLVK